MPVLESEPKTGVARIDLDLLDALKGVSERHDVPVRRLIKDAVKLFLAVDQRCKVDEAAK